MKLLAFLVKTDFFGLYFLTLTVCFNNLRQNFASQLVQKHHNVVFNAVRQQF